MTKLKVGDKVKVKGGFGLEAAKVVVVEAIEVCPNGSKYGEDVDQVEWSKVNSRNVVISYLDRWAYGTQVSRV